MQIKVNKRKGKYHVVCNTRDGSKYVAPFGHMKREGAEVEAKLYRDGKLNRFAVYQWKKETQTF